MLIYTPNNVPKSFREKLETYIPSVRFRHIDALFPLFADVPFVDTHYRPPQVGYQREYTRKCFLSITHVCRTERRERRSSGYDVYFDGVRLLLYLGSKNALIEKTAFGEENQRIDGTLGRWRSDFGKEGDFRQDLDNERIQKLIMDMLEEHWQSLLQQTI